MTNKDVPSPDSVLGYNVGERWTKNEDILRYMRSLADKSEKVKAVTIGKTWEEKEICLVIISASKNMRKLERIKEITRSLSDPREMLDIESVVSEGRAVMLTICGAHGYEASNTEMSMNLAYHLATSDDPETQEILENVVLLLCPGINPDGRDRFVEWYRSIDSPYSPEKHYSYREARGNHYGFDLNRQYILASQPESKAMLRTFNEWMPQVLVDLHGAGWNMDVRYYFDPFGPIASRHEDIDGKLEDWFHILCGNIAKAFDEKGFSYRKETGTILSNPASATKYSDFRGCAGILFESSDPGTGISRSVPVPPLYGKQWTLKDMINYHFTATMAVLSSLAKNRESILRDFRGIRSRAIEKGRSSPPHAYIIPARQSRSNAVVELLNALIAHNIEIHMAGSSFEADGSQYAAGTYIIPMSQPERSIAKTLLEKEPKLVGKEVTKALDESDRWVTGTKGRTAWSLPMAMGVNVVEVQKPFTANMNRVTKPELPKGEVIGGKAKFAYAINYNVNNAVKALSKLLKEGYKARWAKEVFKARDEFFVKGSILIPVAEQRKGIHEEINSLAEGLGLRIFALDEEAKIDTYDLRLPRIAVYDGKGCHGFNQAHVGLVKYALTMYGFDYALIDEKQIKSGSLKNFNLLIIPDSYPEEIMMGYMYNAPYPYKEKEGLEEVGAKNLEAFLRNGGHVIGLGLSGELFTKDYLGICDTDFIGEGYSGGMVVRLSLDTDHPISYGYEGEILAYYGYHPVYDSESGGSVVAKYPDSDVVVAGIPRAVHQIWHHTHSAYVADPSVMYSNAAIVDAKVGKGHAVLIGLDPLFRNYWRSTFRLFFNSVLYSTLDA